jgi:hypothetical protein
LGNAIDAGEPPLHEDLAVNFQPMVVSRFDEVIDAKLPVDPRLPMTGMERADRKPLLPVSA